MRQGNGGRADKLGIQAKLRAGGIAQTTVDAAGELVILGHLRRGLLVRPLIRRTRVANDVRLNGFQAFDKVGHVDHQIAFDWEISQGFDLHPFRVFTQEGFTGQLWHFVDHHPAGAANRHTAGPAVAQVRRQIVFDVAQRIQQGGLLIVRNFIESAVRRAVHFRVIAHHFNFQSLHFSHSPSPFSRLLPLLHRKRVSPVPAW
ncbi:hypothetical protein D3C76_1170620 [compost metagenome]